MVIVIFTPLDTHLVNLQINQQQHQTTNLLHVNQIKINLSIITLNHYSQAAEPFL